MCQAVTSVSNGRQKYSPALEGLKAFTYLEMSALCYFTNSQGEFHRTRGPGDRRGKGNRPYLNLRNTAYFRVHRRLLAMKRFA